MAEPAREVQLPPDILTDLEKMSKGEILQVIFETLCPSCLARFKSRASECLAARKKMNSSTVSDFAETSTFTSNAEEAVELSNCCSPWSSKLTPPQSVNLTSKDKVALQTPLVSLENNRAPSGLEFTFKDGLSSELIGSEGLSEEEKERIRWSRVGTKKDFCHRERIDGRLVNIVEGIELYTNVFNAEEQKKIVASVSTYQKLGQKNQLLARTYSEPKKWMRGKGRATIQFGCCYNYAMDKDGNPPGIIRDEEVDPLPPLLKNMIKRLVRWHILPSTCIPNSCIVNIYDEGDCIPPHIDHHDFVRPFCTVSFLTESNIVFGHNLKILSPGEFSGPVSIPLPVGSVLILNGKGADVAKHCIPSVHGKRISITFRKMDDDKLPRWYRPDPDLQGLTPFMTSVPKKSPSPFQPKIQSQQTPTSSSPYKDNGNEEASKPKLNLDEFPALGSINSTQRKKGGHR